MIDLDKDIELYKSKVTFYESQNTRGEYAVTVRELKFVVEILEALRAERSQSDLISRDDALKAVDSRHEELLHDPEYLRKHCQIDLLGIKKHILAIPPVEARPKGEWIPLYPRTVGEWEYKCSNCGNRGIMWRHNFCPNCGADMRTEDK